MQELADIADKFPPEDRPLVEPLANFILSFIQALLKTGYYRSSHPGAAAAKQGLYQEFAALSRGERELSFVAREGQQPDILVHGVLTEPTLVRTLMTHAMRELFIPKFLQYFERRHLVSFCLKTKITIEEFDGFIDIMSEHPTATPRMKETIRLMTEQLIQRQIVNVSTIYQEEMIAEERQLHWMTRIVLTRLGKDLQVIPLYQHLTTDQLMDVKQQVFRDVLRPVSSPDVLKEVIVNCDLMRLPGKEQLTDIESRLTDSIRPDRLLPTVTSCANDLKRLLSIADSGRSEEESAQYQRLKRVLTLLAPKLWSAKEKLSSDIIETFLKEEILSLGELPDELREEILLERRTTGYLSDRARYLQEFREGWVDEPAQFLISILPGLLARNEPDALHEAVQCLWSAWTRSHAAAITPNRPDPGFLSAVGADRLAPLLVTKFQDATLRHRDDLLPVLELFRDALAGRLLSSTIEQQDIWVRRNACRILAGVGPSIIPALLTLTEARWESWYFVRNAVMILGDIGSADEPVLALLRRCRRHPHPRVQEETLTSYGKLKSPETERALLEALDAGNPALCARAILALGARQSVHDQALRFLRDTLRRKGKEEREADERLQLDGCLALDAIIAAHPEVADSFGPLLREALTVEKGLLSGLTGQKFQQKSPAVRQAIQKLLARIDHTVTDRVAKR